MSGREVLVRLKKDERLRRIPVLIFSSSDALSDLHAAYDGYANGFVTKPGGDRVLTAIVEAIEKFWVEVAKIPKVARSRS